MKISSTTWMIVLAVIVFGIVIGSALMKDKMPSDLDDFAKCITEKGGEIYGTHWCHNCADQKDQFGSSFQYIEYTECSSPGSTTFDLCPGVTAVPLWKTKEGKEYTGNILLKDLAQIFECELPK